MALHREWEPASTITVDASGPKTSVMTMALGAIHTSLTKRIFLLGSDCPPVLFDVVAATRHRLHPNVGPVFAAEGHRRTPRELRHAERKRRAH